MALLEKWKGAVDSGQMFGALLTDLWHLIDLYLGFSFPALKLVHDYLSNRTQKTKINRIYSFQSEIVFGVPQGLYLVHCCLTSSWQLDLFFILNDVDIESYADGNTPYVIADEISGLISSLEKVSKALFK